MPHLATYIGMVHRAEQTLADSLLTVGDGHRAEADVFHTCGTLAQLSQAHVSRLQPVVDRHGEEHAGDDVEEPDRLHAAGVGEVREGSIGLLRDLQDLYLLATLVQTTWTVLYQAAQGVRDRELMTITEDCNADISRVLSWINTRMKAAAPQALLMTP